MILASRVETTLTKSEILELYLNAIYLGRASWGIEMAARSYFGKSARTLTVGEGALLAALTKGPNYFNPDRNPDRAKSRVAYVADRLYEDSVISAEEKARLLATGPKLVSYEGTRHSSHFVDHVAREAKAIAGLDSLTIGSDTVRSTLHSILQEATESALQEGLASYEINSGRVELREVEGNLGEDIRQIELKRKAPGATPAWQQALGRARFPLYDVHWPLAVIVEKPSRRGSDLRVGLSDGRVVPLVVGKSSIQRQLKLHDVVFVRLTEKGKFTQAELRVRPVVQGSAVVLENKTGRILALAGGFSYPLSQLNRVTQATRQPGSSIKPLTYLAALQNGLQPNTLVRDRQITLPPIRSEAGARSWTPKNYGGDESGVITLRQALEKSKNLATVNLLEGGVDANPAQSLDRLCTIALEAQIYKQCMQYYPFVLGAQPVRPIDLATFYATIANEGIRPTPYVIESIEQKGRVVYRHTPSSVEVGYADRVSFYQLKTMLQGVLQNGTARSVAHLAPYVAGKTGTTDGENDAWFAGFTNDVTVVIWVGYDNADGARRTLGEGRTGGNVALPIFEPIIEAVWAHHVPKAELNPPSPQAKNNMVVAHGGRQARDEKGTGLVEYLRRDGTGRAVNSEYKLVSRREDSRASKVVVVRKRQPAFAPDPGQVWTQTYTHTQTQPQSQTQNWSWSGGWDRRSSYRQPSFFDNNRW